MSFKQEYESKKMTFEEAVKLVKDGDRIFINGGGSLSVPLAEALYERKDELNEVYILSSLMSKNLRIYGMDCEGKFHITSSFLGSTDRAAMKQGRTIDNMSYQLRNNLFVLRDVFQTNVCFILARPMDDEGYFNLSLSPSDFDSLVHVADTVIVHVNDQLPHICTDENKIHISKVHAVCEQSEPPVTLPSGEPSDLDKQVASHIVERIPNGACLQIGIGGIANAVGFSLINHKDLGIYTEMYTESMYYLQKNGAVNNSKKPIHTGVSVLGFALGSQDMYDFIHENPKVFSRPLGYTNDPYLVAKHDNFVSVNACLSVDITGQVASEALGKTQFSGTGGQVDFVRGAQMSKGGKSFIATHSVNVKKDGTRNSKIVMSHPEGGIITTGRTDVQYIVTEYGVADLQNKSRMQRAKALIAIAHPDYRDELTFQAKKEGYL